MSACLLAVDTAGPVLSVAVRGPKGVIFLSSASAKPHDETLLPMVERALKKAGVRREALSAIAAAAGPGRFTGIRIGMAFAAVAAAQLRVPALAISRLEGLAWRLPKGRGCAAIAGWKGERYYQLFRRTASIKAEAPPAWESEAGWAARAQELAAGGATVLEAEADARDLLAAAAAALAGRRLPRFAPLYLKPASYEKLAR